LSPSLGIERPPTAASKVHREAADCRKQGVRGHHAIVLGGDEGDARIDNWRAPAFAGGSASSFCVSDACLWAPSVASSPRLWFLILRIAGRRGVISDFISEFY